MELSDQAKKFGRVLAVFGGEIMDLRLEKEFLEAFFGCLRGGEEGCIEGFSIWQEFDCWHLDDAGCFALPCNHWVVLAFDIIQAGPTNLSKTIPGNKLGSGRSAEAAGAAVVALPFLGSDGKTKRLNSRSSRRPSSVSRSFDDISVSETHKLVVPSLLAARRCSLSIRYFQPIQPREILAAETHPIASAKTDWHSTNMSFVSSSCTHEDL